MNVLADVDHEGNEIAADSPCDQSVWSICVEDVRIRVVINSNMGPQPNIKLKRVTFRTLYQVNDCLTDNSRENRMFYMMALNAENHIHVFLVASRE